MSVLREREHWGFKSGGTVQFDQMHQKILDIIKSDENPFTGQDFFVNLKKREEEARKKGLPFYVADYRKELYGFFEQWMKKDHEFPKYKYMINYLFANYPSASGKVEKHKDELFIQLEQLEQGSRKTLTADALECLELIVDCLMRDFSEAKPSEEDWVYYTREWIKEQIINPTEEFVFDFLAPVLEMLTEEINVFLTRVLKRHSLDVFDDREFLLYLILTCDFTESKFNSYKRLKDVYKEMDDSQAVPEGTVYIAESLEKKAEKLADKTLSDVDGNFSKELMEILKWRKQFKARDVRSDQETFERMLDELCTLYAKEVEDYQKHMVDVNAAASLDERIKEGIVELIVAYDGTREIRIPAGTEFYGEHNQFELQFDKILPIKNSFVKVPVRPVTASKKEGDQFLPLNAGLLMLDDSLMEKCRVAAVRTLTKEENRGRGKDLNAPAFVKGAGEGTGYLCIECACGNIIPAGTEFLYEDTDGMDYLFRSTEDVHADAAEESIYVTMKDNSRAVIIKQAKPEDPQNIWEETGAIRNIGTSIEGIRSVWNPKRAGIRDDRFAKEEKDGSARLTIQFPYDKVILLEKGTRFYNLTKKGKVYNMFVLPEQITLKETKTEKYFFVPVEPLTMMPAHVKKNKALKNGELLVAENKEKYPDVVYAEVGNKEKPFCYKETEGKKETKAKKIKVCLKQGADIPAGVRFICDTGKEQLTYITLEPMQYLLSEVSGIRVECEGQNYKRRSNTGDLVYADAETITAMDAEVKAKGILSVTNPKAALKAENPAKKATREEFFAYLYSRKDAEAKDSITAEVEGKLDFDIQLMKEEWFTNSYLYEGTGENFEQFSAARKRALILTFAFMKYIKEKGQAAQVEENWDEEAKKRLALFAEEANESLDQSRMNGFDMGSPLDAFYGLLLLEEDACDTMRLLYKVMFD